VGADDIIGFERAVRYGAGNADEDGEGEGEDDGKTGELNVIAIAEAGRMGGLCI
jgi:hypothetical protein